MCLAIPSEVKEIDRDDNTAIVDTMGARTKASLDLLDEEIRSGDYVLLHVGFAIKKIDEEEALETIKLFEEMLEKTK